METVGEQHLPLRLPLRHHLFVVGVPVVAEGVFPV